MDTYMAIIRLLRMHIIHLSSPSTNSVPSAHSSSTEDVRNFTPSTSLQAGSIRSGPTTSAPRHCELCLCATHTQIENNSFGGSISDAEAFHSSAGSPQRVVSVPATTSRPGTIAPLSAPALSSAFWSVLWMTLLPGTRLSLHSR